MDILKAIMAIQLSYLQIFLILYTFFLVYIIHKFIEYRFPQNTIVSIIKQIGISVGVAYLIFKILQIPN